MIVVKVELHSAITGQITLLGKAIIANDGRGTCASGNYWMDLRGKNNVAMKDRVRIEKWPRQAKHVWALVARMLQEVYPPYE